VPRRAGSYLSAERMRPVLDALPDLNADRSGGDLDRDLAPGVEEAAEVAVRRLADAVAFRILFRPFAAERVGRQVIGFRLVEVAIRADDVDATMRRLAGGLVAHGTVETAGTSAVGGRRFALAVEAGGSEKVRLVLG